MMKYLQFTLILIIGFIIASEAQNISPLDTYSKIDKENIKQHSFDLKIQNYKTIDLMSMIKSPVDGLAVSGKGILFSDSSLIRIIASNEYGDDFMVYEANCILNDIGNIQFHNYQDETFLLNSFYPIKLKIQIVDAEVELKKLVSYNITTQQKEQKEQRYKSIKKEMAQFKLSKVEEYISRNKMIWSAEINPFNSSLYKNKKLLYGEKYNSYGIEYYQDGFFSIPESVSNSEQDFLNSGSMYVDEFDWRNRHGQNWMTENNWLVRELCLTNLEFLGIKFNAEINKDLRGHDAKICTDCSKVQVMVIQTNEELVIAKETVRLVKPE